MNLPVASDAETIPLFKCNPGGPADGIESPGGTAREVGSPGGGPYCEVENMGSGGGPKLADMIAGS